MYLKRHRNIEPAVYNESRILEQPIPNTHQELAGDITASQDGNASIDFSMSQESQNCTTPTVDPISLETENLHQEADDVEQKPNVSQLAMRVANNNDILNLIDADDDAEIISFEGDEIEMIVGPKGFAKPMVLMDDNRIKRENDEISGSEPYYETVSISNTNCFLKR